MDRDPRALTAFREQLDPYGYWVQDPAYGMIWVPHASVVGSDFAPYVSAGRWGLTDDGYWMWRSDYPFGGVVFHYGRWVWVSGRGWAWVPGYRYAPAWVTWRVPTGPYAYIGWAPMPPSWGWFGGLAVGWNYPFMYPYVYCPSSWVFHWNFHHHIVRDRFLAERIAQSTRRYYPANPRIAGPGPRPAGPVATPVLLPRGPSLTEARIPRSAIPDGARVRTTLASPRLGNVGSFPARPGLPGARPEFAPRGELVPRGREPRPLSVQPRFTPSPDFRANPRINPMPRVSPPSTTWRSEPRPYPFPRAPGGGDWHVAPRLSPMPHSPPSMGPRFSPAPHMPAMPRAAPHVAPHITPRGR